MADDPYTEENYQAYREWFLAEYPGAQLLPSSFDAWRAWNLAMDSLPDSSRASELKGRVVGGGGFVVNRDRSVATYTVVPKSSQA